MIYAPLYYAPDEIINSMVLPLMKKAIWEQTPTGVSDLYLKRFSAPPFVGSTTRAENQ